MLGGHFPPLPIRSTKHTTHHFDSKGVLKHSTGTDYRLSRTTQRSYADLFRIIHCYASREVAGDLREKCQSHSNG